MADTTQRLDDMLASARRGLVETGTRNRLVHVNRSAARANALTVVNERTEDVFDTLRVRGARMTFAASATAPDAKGDAPLMLMPPRANAAKPKARGPRYLETTLSPKALATRLVRLHNAARTAEEERGTNILYLACGFLQWFEHQDEATPREAPLILIPVDLIRNDGASNFDLRARDDDIVTNLPLAARLEDDFGIALPQIDDSTDWTPGRYFAQVAEAVSGYDRWAVDEDGMQLGFFSFSKFVMLRDLDPAQWPEDRLRTAPLLRGLLMDGFEDVDTPAPEGRLDEHLALGDLLHVVDADASQAQAIDAVRQGQNLVVQGPPGTGKSQTITNILAMAAHAGKRVLFVAEKAAALEVVHRRMVAAGLGDLCLELHSHSANKKAFLAELARTLGNAGTPAPKAASPDALRAARDDLNDLTGLLHQPVPGRDYTPFAVMSALSEALGRDAKVPGFAVPSLGDRDAQELQTLRETVSAYSEAASQVHPPPAHPLYGVTETGLQPTELRRLSAQLRATQDGAQELQTLLETPQADPNLTVAQAKRLAALLSHLAHRPATRQTLTLAQSRDDAVRGALTTGAAWVAARDALADVVVDAAWAAPLGPLRQDIAKAAASRLARIFGGYRGAKTSLAALLRGPLPDGPEAQLALVDQMMAAQSAKARFEDEKAFLQAQLGPVFRGAETDFDGLLAAADWLQQAVQIDPDLTDAALEKAAALNIDPGALETASARVEASCTDCAVVLGWQVDWPQLPLPDLAARLSAVDSGLAHYGAWADYNRLRTQMQDAGLRDLADDIERSQAGPDSALDTLAYLTLEAQWKQSVARCDGLDDLARLDRDALVDRFQTLETARFAEVQALIRDTHLAQLPRGAAGQMGFLRGEMAKKTRHRAIRTMMKAAGPMVQRIKPVMMMSPISVAQFLEPGCVSFDLLVIDEASQVRPEDALGVVARADQIVVIGDQKQLPPTSFFDRLAATERDEDEDEDGPIDAARAEELESILSLCEARGLPQKMLEWHYRSRDPSLIAQPNALFYDGRLVLPPAPLAYAPQAGLHFHQVPGVYGQDRGQRATNRIEADAVIDALRAIVAETPEASVGIAAFSAAQKDMLLDRREVARAKDPALDAYLRAGRPEPLFIKNIENVQGDERDIILVSVGYGPDTPGGAPPMRFGPVNQQGGERRLNVLFTRARLRCDIFASFSPDALDLSRASGEGPAVLQRVLNYAAQRSATSQAPEKREAQLTPLAWDITRTIEAAGYDVVPQFGTDSMSIELAVRSQADPDRFVLAVETDGPIYRDAAWARERDRLRHAVLGGMGWSVHRVWSSDWFHDRARETDRLLDRIRTAQAAEPPALVKKPALLAAPQSADARSTAEFEPPAAPKGITMPAYERATLSVRSKAAPQDYAQPKMIELVTRVVGIEGPVHTEEVSRRVAAGFGRARTSAAITATVKAALELAADAESILADGAFWMTQAQADAPPIRDRSDITGPGLGADYLSAQEIRAAARFVDVENGAMTQDERETAVARVLGYQRTGPDLRARLRDVLG